ncbi:MAG TPA: tetratricopeptide repeat protein, partial [Gemmataceae bacterium]|nr:tetratricopeptide repeat protein [Gemmataceae bacterium]
ESALPIFDRLTEAHPDVPAYRHEQAHVHHALGYLLLKTHKLDRAREVLERGVSLSEQVVRERPGVTEYERGLATLLHTLAFAHENQGQATEARVLYQRSLPIQERMFARDPDNPDCQHALAEILHDLGLNHQLAGQIPEARALYERAMPIREQVANEHTTVADYQHCMIMTINNLGTLYKDTGEPAKAKAMFEKGLPACDRLARAQNEVPAYRELAHSLRLVLAGMRAAAGEHGPAIRETEEVLASPDPAANVLYGAACVYSLASAAVGKDATIQEAERAALVEKYAVRAVALLRQAAARGLELPNQVKGDVDLVPLRGRTDFQKLLEELEKKPGSH